MIYDLPQSFTHISLSLLQVDMSLTKKEFMMAVKLCSDVAVQRGLPNMRLRAAKNFHSKGKVCLWVVGGCCTVGRPIASHTKGPGFESSHLQFL